MGALQVPADCYWGAQTQRSLQNFRIGGERMPAPLVHAFGIQKKAAAQANMALGALDKKLGHAIVQASDEIASGKLDAQSRSSSGRRLWHPDQHERERSGGQPGERDPGPALGRQEPDPSNDQVNMGQSSNDSFPAVMHIAAATEINQALLPASTAGQGAGRKARAFTKIIKIGRTHLQDATPLSLGQEFSGYATQVTNGIRRVKATLPSLYQLARAAPRRHRPQCKGRIRRALRRRGGKDHPPAFVTAKNKFEALAAHDAMVEASGALNVLAVSLMKIANDIRLLGSGRVAASARSTCRRTSRLVDHAGKVNPTQAEAMTMVAAQVMGNHVTVTLPARTAISSSTSSSRSSSSTCCNRSACWPTRRKLRRQLRGGHRAQSRPPSAST